MQDIPDTIELVALETQNLDTVCYRGTAPLAHLAMISQADVFDQVTNPGGLQRDISLAHARDAYDYAAREADKEHPRAFPEVILNVRAPGKRVMALSASDNLAFVSFDMTKLLKLVDKGTVAVSRVDGHHRLYYGAGDGKNRPPLDVPVPFQLHVGLTPDQERGMFVDINAEQKGLNTSHLHVQRLALTSEEAELIRNPARVFARRLTEDAASPFAGKVYLGGSRKGLAEAKTKTPITFTALETAIKRLLRSEYMQTIVTDPDARYELVRRYWQAVQATMPDAFERPAEYLVLKNMGLQSLARVGMRVLDRVLARGATEVQDMQRLVAPAMGALDWTLDSPDVAGMSGNQATRILADKMQAQMPELVAA